MTPFSANFSDSKSFSEIIYYNADTVLVDGSATASVSGDYSISIDSATGDLLSLSFSGNTQASSSHHTTNDAIRGVVEASGSSDLNIFYYNNKYPLSSVCS